MIVLRPLFCHVTFPCGVHCRCLHCIAQGETGSETAVEQEWQHLSPSLNLLHRASESSAHRTVVQAARCQADLSSGPALAVRVTVAAGKSLDASSNSNGVTIPNNEFVINLLRTCNIGQLLVYVVAL